MEYFYLWGAAILLVVFIIIYFIFSLIHELRLSDKLDNSKGLQAELKAKHTLLRWRKIRNWTLIAIVFLFILYFLCAFLLGAEASFWQISIVSCLFVIVFVFRGIKEGLFDEIKSWSGNISFTSVQDVLSKPEPFALFLRGFEDDLKYEYGFAPISTFSEEYLTRVVNKGLHVPLYAIGRPKEIDCPQGATRIYIDDQDWQKGVSDLIQRAVKVFILINDRDSCIWELQNCEEVKKKCVFIITNPQKYRNATAKLSNSVSFMSEELPDGFDNGGPYYFSEGKPLKTIANGYIAYNDMAGVDPPVSLAADKKTPEEKAEKAREDYIIYYVIGVLVSGVISAVLFFII